MGKRERGREREREGGRDRKRDRERQIDRQTVYTSNDAYSTVFIYTHAYRIAFCSGMCVVYVRPTQTKSLSCSG